MKTAEIQRILGDVQWLGDAAEMNRRAYEDVLARETFALSVLEAVCDGNVKYIRESENALLDMLGRTPLCLRDVMEATVACSKAKGK